VLSTYKALDLEPGGLGHTVSQQPDGAYAISLSAKGLALFMMLEADRAGRFSDNAFDLLAGESRTIVFTPDVRGDAPIFVVRDLHSCQAVE
jgi:beta-mannosidase